MNAQISTVRFQNDLLYATLVQTQTWVVQIKFMIDSVQMDMFKVLKLLWEHHQLICVTKILVSEYLFDDSLHN